MPLYRNYIDGEESGRIIVFSKRDGAPTSAATSCVISAHGTQSLINSNFRVRGMNLLFYGPHGSTLVDPGLEDIITGRIQIYETLTSDMRCQDYWLSKYQGTHNTAGETYQTIESLPETFDNIRSKSTLESRIQEYSRWMDIVTIRNRYKFLYNVVNPISLSTVIFRLYDNGYRYSTVHCSFCRSPTLAIKRPSYKPQLIR